jgi:hypothetical protein
MSASVTGTSFRRCKTNWHIACATTETSRVTDMFGHDECMLVQLLEEVRGSEAIRYVRTCSYQSPLLVI